MPSSLQETERKPESRKLELNGYLTKPTTRLGRYNLLLREILKHTPADNVDCEVIPRVMDIIKDFLARVNTETGKAENRFNLQLISDRLSWKNPADGIVSSQATVTMLDSIHLHLLYQFSIQGFKTTRP